MRYLLRAITFLGLSGELLGCSGGAPVSTTGAGGGDGQSRDAGAGTGGARGAAGIGGGGAAGGMTGTGGKAAGAGGVTGAGGRGTGGSVAGSLGGTIGTTVGAVSVLQHHNNPSRDGVYVDARLTRAAAATVHLDPSFSAAPILGPVYAQPLYLVGTGGGPDLVLVATAQNHVYALNAATGAAVWNVQVGNPVTPGVAGLCGAVLNPLGIVGTPVIDATTRTLYLSAMTNTAASGARHLVHALGIDGGGVERAGWPVDLMATARSGATTFNSAIQNQRAALVLLGGKVFVPFGGHIGDCDGYHGWVVGITTAGAPAVSAWATTAIAGGIWGSGGIASDGTSLYVSTGNTKAAAASGAFGTSPTSWGGGEAIIKFPTTVVQPALAQTTDYFFPSGWAALDQADADLGGTGPVLFTVPGASPANLLMALGKDGNAYLLDRANLGGMDAQPLQRLHVAGGVIINAAAAYRTATASYVVFKNGNQPVGCPGGQTGALTAIRVSAASPPVMSIAWCGGGGVVSSPAVSMTTTQGADALVWYAGSDNRLHAVDGDTGQSVVADTTALGAVVPHQTPVITGGRVFVASSNRVFAFTP